MSKFIKFYTLNTYSLLYVNNIPTELFLKKKMSLVGDKLLALPINKGPNI